MDLCRCLNLRVSEDSVARAWKLIAKYRRIAPRFGMGARLKGRQCFAKQQKSCASGKHGRQEGEAGQRRQVAARRVVEEDAVAGGAAEHADVHQVQSVQPCRYGATGGSCLRPNATCAPCQASSTWLLGSEGRRMSGSHKAIRLRPKLMLILTMI